MEQQWYYAVGGTQQGPVDQQTLQRLIAGGQVSGNDLVWRDGMPDWVPAQTVAELMPAAPAPAVNSGVGQPAPAQQYPPSTPYAPVSYMPSDPATAQLQSKASTAMIVGIISIVLSACVCGPAGLALGIWGWTAGSKIPPGYPFSGQGKTGMICGIIGTILGVLSSILGILYVIGMAAAGM